MHEKPSSPPDSQVRTVLLWIFRAANTASSVAELCAEIHVALSRLIDTSNIYVALYDKQTGLYSFPYHVDQYETEPQPEQSLAGSLTDYVRRTARPLLVDERLHQELTELGEVELVGVPSPIWLGVPLTTNGECIGVAAVQSYDQEALYSESDRELLTFVAENIGQLLLRKKAEQEVRESERRFRALFEASPDGIFVEDLEGTVLDANPSACRLQGIERDDLIGMNVAQLVPQESRDEALEHFAQLASGEVEQAEGFTLTGDGRKIPVEVRANRFEYSGRTALLVQVRDITQRKEHEERLDYLARFDALTGLPNRTLFEEEMRRATRRAERRGEQIALLYLDLDEFKNINDTLGHLVGDELLAAVAQRLRQDARDTDFVARLGGDEFGIILGEIDGLSGVSTYAVRVLRSMARKFELEEHAVYTNTSIGISLSSPGQTAGDLMLQADRALYKAKERGRNNFQFHDDKLAREVERYVEVRADFRGAVERGEFRLEYQPQIALDSGRVVGCEALVRWQHPTRGLLYPGAFIPIIDGTSDIIPLGRWVVEEACRQRRRWTEDGLPGFAVAVNLSATQFRDSRFIPTLEDALAANSLSPEMLELEITETVLMQESSEVRQALELLGGRGVSFSIDDFGTGYSSLRYLREFTVHKLKIAMEFVQGVTQDVDDAAIVEAVISLGHNLGIGIVAEGVETAEQADFLRRRGCDQAQGFYFSRPIAADAFAQLLADNGSAG